MSNEVYLATDDSQISWSLVALVVTTPIVALALILVFAYLRRPRAEDDGGLRDGAQ